MKLNPSGTKPGEAGLRSTIPKPGRASRRLTPFWLLGFLALGFLSACRTGPRLPSVNVAEPGWTLREGQGLWRSQRDGPEIAGEIIVASHADGRSLVQFTKTPLPFLTAQTTPKAWQIEFIPEKRVISGRGEPPAQFIWLHLARALIGTPILAPLKFQKLKDGIWHLDNSASGESLTVYLAE